MQAAASAGAKKRRQKRTFWETFLHKAQKPEVILLGAWWLTMLILVVYMAEMGTLLHAIWRPLALLFFVPLVFFAAMAAITV